MYRRIIKNHDWVCEDALTVEKITQQWSVLTLWRPMTLRTSLIPSPRWSLCDLAMLCSLVVTGWAKGAMAGADGGPAGGWLQGASGPHHLPPVGGPCPELCITKELGETL